MGLFDWRKKKKTVGQAESSAKKDIDSIILEMEQQRKQALEELISYRATAKRMKADEEKYLQKASAWQKKAESFVTAGSDDKAKHCLAEKNRCLAQAADIRKDWNEATGYAIDLNASRKTLEKKLQSLRLRKGTLASQLAVAKTGVAIGQIDPELQTKFSQAEEKINSATMEVEVQAAMDQELASDALEPTTTATELPTQEDDALAQLKIKMGWTK